MLGQPPIMAGDQEERSGASPASGYPGEPAADGGRAAAVIEALRVAGVRAEDH